MSTLVVRIPAPGDGVFATDAWAYHVGKLTPVRVLDPRGPEGTNMAESVCTRAEVVEGGIAVLLTYDVVGVDASLVEGLFLNSATVVSVTP